MIPRTSSEKMHTKRWRWFREHLRVTIVFSPQELNLLFSRQDIFKWLAFYQVLRESLRRNWFKILSSNWGLNLTRSGYAKQNWVLVLNFCFEDPFKFLVVHNKYFSKDLILDTLHHCLIIDTSQALENDAMSVFAELLQHESPVVKAKASRDIMGLRCVFFWFRQAGKIRKHKGKPKRFCAPCLFPSSVPLAGKDKAVEVNCMSQLVDLLQDENDQVRANAAGAIMM